MLIKNSFINKRKEVLNRYYSYYLKFKHLLISCGAVDEFFILYQGVYFRPIQNFTRAALTSNKKVCIAENPLIFRDSGKMGRG